ncbi:Hybrid signal transduction histidine kinase K [Paramyrothecium foliicola]|nr:Hybrid signal transduction histidine kinase K [Paramyrothecium foliicola]
MHSSFREVGLVDLLESDPRPSFVAVAGPASQSSSLGILYHNPALVANAALCDVVRAIPDQNVHKPFWAWVTSPSSVGYLDPSTQHSLPYLGILWTRNVVQGKWVIMSGNETPPSSEPPRKIRFGSAKDVGQNRSILSEQSSLSDQDAESKAPILFRATQESSLMPPDFTPDPEPFLDVIQSVDWDANPLGPMDQWPMRLQQAFNQLIPDSRPIGVYWGDKSIAVYNESFSKLMGPRHPELLGSPVAKVWPHVKERIDTVRVAARTKRDTRLEDESRFFIDQPDGTTEETYAKWSLSPIMDGRECLGVQHSVIETTSLRLWERRMQMLIELGEALVTTRTVKDYWNNTMQELARWDPAYDVPLAFIYSVKDKDVASASSSRHNCAKVCRLESYLGVPEGHPIAPAVLDLGESDEGLAAKFREALIAPVPLLLQTLDETLPERLLHGLEWRGFGDPCHAAVILPIHPAKATDAMGILFLGLNPRRPYDNEYRQFMSLLNQKLTSFLATTVLLEEETRRGQSAIERATQDKVVLQRKLADQTEQANRSIQNFESIAEFIPMGMSFQDNQGSVTFANEAWYRITGYPSGPIGPRALIDCALEEDQSRIVQAYEDIKTTDVVTFEFRVRVDGNQVGADLPVNRTPPVFDRTARHVLASAKAERAPDGSIIRLLTCLIDMTVQKHTAEEAIRRAQEAENLKRLAELATVGMYDMSMDGRLLSANNLFWELSGLPKVDLSRTNVEPWQACVVEEDLNVLTDSLEKLKITGRPQAAEIRFKTEWTAEDAGGNMIVAPRWVVATFMPVKSSEGVIQSFTGCLSDVSMQRWQLDQEKLRKEEAIESKRQQENFVDMTSHEMRNPLSAMLHCTDAIIASLSRVQDIDTTPVPMSPPGNHGFEGRGISPGESGRSEEVRKLLEDSIENAEIIVTCAQHQKRIVDDILTMSKLDSKFLAVTPCTVDPIQIVKDALKMFEVEARRVDIVLTSLVDKSYEELGHEFLDLDPSRVKQVLINLLTNALKFTKTGKTRNVTIRMKASKSPPGRNMTVVEFIPRFCDVSDEYEQPALKGRTTPVYLLFEVQDTGQGLTESEMGTLFNRFVQASAKTHVKYGGSGLGLFISRRLTELQNGAIGVASRPGVGSTFAFYIEAYIPSEAARKEAEATAAAAQLFANTNASGSLGSAAGVKAGTSKRLPAPTIQRPTHLGGNERLDGILVVEDNLINQQITRRGLSAKGFCVDVANHGIEALEKLKKSVGARLLSRNNSDGADGLSRGSPAAQPIPINVVLMDIEMPIQDGLTCTRCIRELEQEGQVFCASGGRIPIIAVTANGRPEQVTEAKMAGCDDVLVKPYRIPELIERMQVVVRRMGGLSPSSPVR